MVKEIVIPEPILEDIVIDGKKETARGREAFGELVGYYDNIEDTIFVQQRYVLPSKRGKKGLVSNILDVLHLAVSIPKFSRAYWLVWKHHSRTRNKNHIPAEIEYHTHPIGVTFSPVDIRLANNYEKFLRGNPLFKDVKYASLLYFARENENVIQAINGYGTNIPVLKSTT